MLNVYYPPAHPSDFITKVFFDFSAIQSDIAFVGRDFKCLLNPIIDRVPSKAVLSHHKLKHLVHFVRNYVI